jgi:hypothetical protein
MHKTGARTLAVGGFAAGTAAGALAVFSALGAPTSGVDTAQATITPQTTAFGHARVVVGVGPKGVCYTVVEPNGRSHACRARLRVNQIGYTVSPRGVGGVAGANVRGVIIKLTRRGTTWAKLRNGAFFADVPTPYRVRAVIKILRDGSRKRFAVTPSP